METKTNLKIVIIGLFFFCSVSINVFAQQPELIWEKVYKCENFTTVLGYARTSLFKFSDRHTDRINLFQTVAKVFYIDGSNQSFLDSTLLYATQIDMETGDFVGNVNFITLFGAINNNIVYANDSAYIPIDSRRPLIKIDFNNEGNRFIPHYPGTNIYWDTTKKVGPNISNLKYDNLYSDSLYTERFYYNNITKAKLIPSDTNFSLDTLFVSEDVLGKEFLDYENDIGKLGISTVGIDRIDSNTNLVNMFLDNGSSAGAYHTGWLFTTYDNSGKVLSTNIFKVPQEFYTNKGIFNKNYYHHGYNVYNYFTRLFDNTGDLLFQNDANLRDQNTPILYKYTLHKDAWLIIDAKRLSIQSFDETEIVAHYSCGLRTHYVSGPIVSTYPEEGDHNEANSMNFYFSKRRGIGDSLIIDYEYEWRKVVDGDTLGTCIILSSLYRDGYVYLLGVVDRVGYYFHMLKNMENPDDTNYFKPGQTYLYVAKFKEPETYITESPTITNSLISPNPTDGTATLSFDVESSGTLRFR